MSELKEKIFFNKIFLDNMQEMFQKHSCENIIDDYIDSLSQYIYNIEYITTKIEENDPTIKIDRNSSFEQRLVVERNIDDQIITTYGTMGGIRYRFLNSIIYYLTILDDGYHIAISFIDPRRSMYSTVLSHDLNQHTVYWKSDDCIRDYLSRRYKGNTVAMKITSSSKDPHDITKVEYNGNTSEMKKICTMFPTTALVLSNPYIYTDDICRIIDLKTESSPVTVHQESERIFKERLFRRDILIEYPSTSFDVYLEFLSSIIKDKNTDSIYLSLYRIGDDPVIYYILRDAVQRGVYVHVNIELQASNELINDFWVEEMRDVGIHVSTYGDEDIKVHCKLTLIQFKDGRRFAQIGTGNYHSQTTTKYTDLSLITSNDDICRQVRTVFGIFDDADARYLFNENFLITKINMRSELLKLIRREAALKSRGYITIKCNSLSDSEFCDALDEAAEAGCKINLIVRGVCTWVPDLLDYNVMVKSVVWDKLEHSRIYCFGNVNPTMYIGSLDLVTEKLDKRIETLVKILDPDVLKRLCEYTNQYITNFKNSWLLMRSGEYIKET